MKKVFLLLFSVLVVSSFDINQALEGTKEGRIKAKVAMWTAELSRSRSLLSKLENNPEDPEYWGFSVSKVNEEIAELEKMLELHATIKGLKEEINITDDPVKREKLKSELKVADEEFQYFYDTCKDQNNDEHKCVHQCTEISMTRFDRFTCESLPVKVIAEITKVHEWFQNYRSHRFMTAPDPESIDLYLSIAENNFYPTVRKFSKGEIINFLFQFAGNEDLAKPFDYYLDVFIEEFESSTAVYTLFAETRQNIDGVDISLIEAAIGAGNETAIGAFYYYITGSSSCEEGGTSVECFQVFCQIGRNIENKPLRHEWLLSRNFEGYIEQIIEEGVNKIHWKNENYRELTDVHKDEDGDWIDKLCGTSPSEQTTAQIETSDSSNSMCRHEGKLYNIGDRVGSFVCFPQGQWKRRP